MVRRVVPMTSNVPVVFIAVVGVSDCVPVVCVFSKDLAFDVLVSMLVIAVVTINTNVIRCNIV
jgi:hypothetical protein